jgi:hypothetical protein
MNHLSEEQKEFLRAQVCEATEEHIKETTDALFEQYTLLETISWTQYSDSDGVFLPNTEDFIINEESYWGDESWKLDVNNQLIWAFDDIEPWVLQQLYGDYKKVIISREGTETEPYDSTS